MNKLKFATVAISLFVAGVLFQHLKEAPKQDCRLCLDREVTPNDPPCLQMYFSIEKFADKYNVPKKYAYGVAYAETRYEGPFDWNYKHTQKSFAGAIGPMQIMPSTARMMWPDSTITNKRLMCDIIIKFLL